MIRLTWAVAAVVVVWALACPGPAQEITDPEEARADFDFRMQGEYLGEGRLGDGSRGKVGAQVVARGEGQFQVVLYMGGLPGAGWSRGDERFFMEGRRDGEVTRLKGQDAAGTMRGDKLTVTDAGGKETIHLARTQRKSPTLGAEPPSGAVVLFDGTNVDYFPGAVLTPMKTLQAGTTCKSEFDIRRLHLEFRLSWKPKARGQGRSNSGVYLGGCPEIQVLDSFGLEGRKNECGALYGRREPDVNMCLPPLVWQTFDVEITPPAEDPAGDKPDRARLTVRHNGVLIHKDYELSRGSSGPRRIHLQRHGNRVQYRNIWLVEHHGGSD